MKETQDLSTYRLNSECEFITLYKSIPLEKLNAYKERVFKLLGALQEKEYFDIVKNIRVENQEVFIKCVCLYIIQTGADCNVEFTDNFLQLRGIQSYNAGLKEMREYRRQVERIKGNFYDKKES